MYILSVGLNGHTKRVSLSPEINRPEHLVPPTHKIKTRVHLLSRPLYTYPAPYMFKKTVPCIRAISYETAKELNPIADIF
jgi:hypothetical protein